jgi:hypothetical protein
MTKISNKKHKDWNWKTKNWTNLHFNRKREKRRVLTSIELWNAKVLDIIEGILGLLHLVVRSFSLFGTQLLLTPGVSYRTIMSRMVTHRGGSLLTWYERFLEIPYSHTLYNIFSSSEVQSWDTLLSHGLSL